MEYERALQQLTEHALNFHNALVAGEVYISPLTREEFLNQTQQHLSRTARNIARGSGNFELAHFSLPYFLIFDLKDWLPVTGWDYEFGYEAFLQDLEKLFEKIGRPFSWSYNPTLKLLQYELSDIKWGTLIEKWEYYIDPRIYLEIEGNLTDGLEDQDLTLYDITTGDQTGMLAVIPIAAIPLIQDYWISVQDPRSNWFYNGIPDGKRST